MGCMETIPPPALRTNSTVASAPSTLRSHPTTDAPLTREGESRCSAHAAPSAGNGADLLCQAACHLPRSRPFVVRLSASETPTTSPRLEPPWTPTRSEHTPLPSRRRWPSMRCESIAPPACARDNDVELANCASPGLHLIANGLEPEARRRDHRRGKRLPLRHSSVAKDARPSPLGRGGPGCGRRQLALLEKVSERPVVAMGWDMPKKALNVVPDDVRPT
jgi:hypothetical protein